MGTLRQRTLDTVEGIAAWRRKVSPSEPFIYYGADYLAGEGSHRGCSSWVPHLTTTRARVFRKARSPCCAFCSTQGSTSRYCTRAVGITYRYPPDPLTETPLLACRVPSPGFALQ